jgi:hypothetical protein
VEGGGTPAEVKEEQEKEDGKVAAAEEGGEVWFRIVK